MLLWLRLINWSSWRVLCLELLVELIRHIEEGRICWLLWIEIRRNPSLHHIVRRYLVRVAWVELWLHVRVHKHCRIGLVEVLVLKVNWMLPSLEGYVWKSLWVLLLLLTLNLLPRSLSSSFLLTVSLIIHKLLWSNLYFNAFSFDCLDLFAL